MQSATSSLLIATVPPAAARLLRILATYRPVVAASGDEARSLVEQERFALAILGVYFDGSRMFELMSHIRATLRNRNVPILCVLGVRGTASDATIAIIEETVNTLDRCEFLNLAAIPDDEAGDALVLRRVARYVSVPALALAPDTIRTALRP